MSLNLTNGTSPSLSPALISLQHAATSPFTRHFSIVNLHSVSRFFETKSSFLAFHCINDHQCSCTIHAPFEYPLISCTRFFQFLPIVDSVTPPSSGHPTHFNYIPVLFQLPPLHCTLQYWYPGASILYYVSVSMYCATL